MTLARFWRFTFRSWQQQISVLRTDTPMPLPPIQPLQAKPAKRMRKPKRAKIEELRKRA